MSGSSTSRLIVPETRFHSSWLHANAEWRAAFQHGAALHLAEGLDLDKGDDFGRWVGLLIDDEAHPRPGMTTSTNRWLVDGGDYLGAAQLRHELSTDYLRRRGGHIGYGVRPSARGRGLATLALGEMLREAGSRGLRRVLVTCGDTNDASAAVIRRWGGRLDRRDTEPDLLRFWIELE